MEVGYWYETMEMVCMEVWGIGMEICRYGGVGYWYGNMQVWRCGVLVWGYRIWKWAMET